MWWQLRQCAMKCSNFHQKSWQSWLSGGVLTKYRQFIVISEPISCEIWFSHHGLFPYIFQIEINLHIIPSLTLCTFLNTPVASCKVNGLVKWSLRQFFRKSCLMIDKNQELTVLFFMSAVWCFSRNLTGSNLLSHQQERSNCFFLDWFHLLLVTFAIRGTKWENTLNGVKIFSEMKIICMTNTPILLTAFWKTLIMIFLLYCQQGRSNRAFQRPVVGTKKDSIPVFCTKSYLFARSLDLSYVVRYILQLPAESLQCLTATWPLLWKS